MIERLGAALSGRYAIEREIGRGGMATVYLARDLKHNRRVALKVLKPELAAAVGAGRFLAEIETTANLQHPHILPLYDSGEADSCLFYVMPYVEGETLRDRLDRERVLPVDEAVGIAIAVTKALDHAHRQGVVHRDIKPANILLQAGEPVIGDFGIALALDAAAGSRITETGLSLGTPHYMSPEQATGDVHVGPATDIYALGVVLYEMLTGEPPYTGSTAQAVLGRIIQGAPASASALRRAVPANVDAAIRKALERLAADRFATAAELAGALTDPAFRHGADPTVRVRVGAAWRWAAVGFAASTAALGALLALAPRRPEPARQVERFGDPFLADQVPTFRSSSGYDLSPDGTMLVYRHDPGDGQILMVRRWDDLRATPIPGTEGALDPAVSPDGRELAFQQEGQIRVLPFAGGAVRTLVAGALPEWGPDGYVYATTDSGAVRVPSAGGPVEYVSRRAEDEGAHIVYDVLPGGERALLMVGRAGRATEIRGLDLATGASKAIVEGRGPRYLPSGYLVFGTEDLVMMAVRFDPGTMEAVGTPMQIMEDAAYWSLSDDGKLFYSRRGTSAGNLEQVLELVWVTREGEATPIDPGWTFVRGGPDTSWRISPDGALLALRERTEDGNDIWIKQLDAGPRSRLTFGAAEERMPFWAPGGRRVTFLSSRGGGLDVWWQPWDRTGEAALVFDFERDIATAEWSPDGTWLVVRTVGPRGREAVRDVYAIRPGVDSVATPLLADPDYDEIYPTVAPDGRYIAYQTSETGRHEVFVRPFPNVGAGRWQVSVDGGRNPRWAHNGRELFFQGPANEMMVAAVLTSPAFRPGPPRKLFDADPDWAWADLSGVMYDVAPDDRRFVVARVVATEGVVTPVVVLVNNFAGELRTRVPN